MVGLDAVAGPAGPTYLPIPLAIRVPSVARCGAMIFVLKVGLRLFGFSKAIRWIGHHVRSIPVGDLADPDAVRATERAVAMAGALYPGRALCLEQSLLLYYVLRRQGVPVAYCQGVMASPFQAHAWVEYRGEVINDIEEHARQFARLPDQLP